MITLNYCKSDVSLVEHDDGKLVADVHAARGEKPVMAYHARGSDPFWTITFPLQKGDATVYLVAEDFEQLRALINQEP